MDAGQAPHLRGTFSAAVVHGEGESENAGHTRGGVPADAYSVICDAKCAAVSGITVGDTLRLESGVVLDVQQITKDPLFGWVIKCTANARAPK